MNILNQILAKEKRRKLLMKIIYPSLIYPCLITIVLLLAFHAGVCFEITNSFLLYIGLHKYLALVLAFILGIVLVAPALSFCILVFPYFEAWITGNNMSDLSFTVWLICITTFALLKVIRFIDDYFYYKKAAILLKEQLDSV